MIEQQIIKYDLDYPSDLNRKIKEMNSQGWKIVQISCTMSANHLYEYVICLFEKNNNEPLIND